MGLFADFIEQSPQVLASADAADGACQNVIEDQRRNREPAMNGPMALRTTT